MRWRYAGIPIMSACPRDDELLRFLDGELRAEDDARIVAHIEDCVMCQASLERLTRGSPALGARQPIDTVQTDPEGTTDLVRTEVIDVDDEPDDDSCQCQPTDLGGETCAGIDEATDPERTCDFILTPSSRIGDTEETSPDNEAEVGDSDGTGTTDLTDDEREPTGRRKAAPGWPTIPGYDILQQLGEGGMGVVYKARHRGLNRLVALKMIRGGSQARTDYFARFRVEAESVAQLRHPNIIQIYDINEADGLPFVALELLDGGGLDAQLAGNPQPGRQSAELMITLARAVHVAHQSAIIHRDLKPTNVLYTSDGVPKITDFGLAKRIDSDGGQTESGQIMGSPSYMAPEQARGHSRKVGPAADVYALGAILYEMLTGRPPFKGETPIETIRQVIDDDPVAPSQLVPRLPRDLETICLKCLHKEATRRYESAEGLADDLTRYVRGEPILARRTTILERGIKWARRRPLIAASWVLGIGIASVLILGFFVYQRSELQRGQTFLATQTKGYNVAREADAAQTEEELEDAWVHLSAFVAEMNPIKNEPRAKELSNLVAMKLADVDDKLAALRSRQAERDRQREERDRLQKFPKLLSDALFLDAQFTGLDLPSNQEATRRAARAALDLFAAPGSGDSWALRPLPPFFSDAERADVAEGCYELLLVLAEVEITPDQGMRRLDEAARLRPPTKAYYLRRAACLARAGNGPAAEKERGAAARLEATTPFDHFLVGQERYKRQDYRAALPHLYAALELQPDHFWAQCLRGISALQLNRPVEAKASLDSCLQQESGFAWLYLLRGFASSQVARLYREQADRLGSPKESLAQMKDQLEAAEADYGRAMGLLDQNPSDQLRYSLLVNRGVLGLQRQALEASAGYLQAAIRLNGRGMEAYAALAQVYQQQGKPDEAIEQFSRAIALRPEWSPLYRGRADVELAREASTPAQRGQALNDLDRAIQLEKPGNLVLARDHLNRARLLDLDHRESEALAACDAAIQVVHDYDDAHRLRIEVLLRSKRHDDVIRSCDPLIARGKASSAIYELRGLAREEIKDFPGAIEDFTNAMAFRGNRESLLRRRGWLYIVADAPQLALHDFEAAIRLDATSGDAYNGRGAARLRLGEHRQAVADAEKALSVGEPKPDLYYKAARVYAVAAIAAAAEVRKKGQETVTLVSRYQVRAADLLRETLRRLPAARRASFLKEVIRKDPQLQTLLRRVSSLERPGEGDPNPLAPAGRGWPKAG
jgi:tetratricopeptide (TPR) repeat protein/tRNA A-37 threonylcarbamoyl transferase component Bud32